MQLAAMAAQPGLVGVHVRADIFHQGPEPIGVIHFPQMGHLMGGEIVQHFGRRKDDTPAEIERS